MMIEFDHVGVVFRGKETVEAVKDVSLTVEDGDIFGIVGFSGAGKSTLVRTINGLTKATSGRVLVDGEDVGALTGSALRKKRQDIGMIFQHFNLFESRTIFENVAYPLRHSNLSREEKKRRVEELLARVGIEEKRNARPSELSGGQKQRVAIARALASNPSILLCDEATSALDPRTTREILKLLRELNEELGITIVLITHEMEVVKEICNKCAVMDGGEVIEWGEAWKIFSDPEKPLTRSFINTTRNLEDVFEAIASDESLRQDPGELVLLRYLGAAAGEPLIAALYERFSVTTNILWGNIERVGKVPIGELLVRFTGEGAHVAEAKTYLEEQGVRIEAVDGIGRE